MNNVELLVRGKPLLPTEMEVKVPPAANKAMTVVIQRANKITVVNDVATQNAASIVAQELQGLMKGLEAHYRAAKAPVLNAERSLDNIYKELNQPLKRAYDNVTGMISRFQDNLRLQEEREKAAKKLEEERLERESRERIAQLEKEKQEQELRSRLAEDGRERAGANRILQRLEGEIQSEQIASQVSKENVVSTVSAPRPKPIGGKPYIHYNVDCTDVKALFAARPELLKWELKTKDAQVLAKQLDEAGIALDSIPGLSIKKETRTAFQGATGIRISE